MKTAIKENIDVAKAIGIILVVMGHSDTPISRFIYLFHLAIFYFISGYLFKEAYIYEPSTLIKKRLKSLYIPFIFYETLFLLVHNLFFKLNIYSVNISYDGKADILYNLFDFIKSFINILTFGVTEQLCGAFWFFTSLFIVNIIFGLISYVIYKCTHKNREKLRFLIIMIMFLIANAASYYNIKNVRTIFTSFAFLLIFYLGYIVSKYGFSIIYNIYFAISSLAFLIVSCFFGQINPVSNIYSSPSFFIMNSVCGIYLTLYLSQIIYKTGFFIKLFKYLGANTRIILVFHFLCFKIVSFIQIKFYKYDDFVLAKFPVISGKHGWWILYTIVGIFVPIIVKYLFESAREKYYENI